MSTTRRRLLIAAGSVVLLGGVAYGGSLIACNRRAARLAADRLGDPSRLFAALPDIADPEGVGAAVLTGRTGVSAASLLPDLAAEMPLREACTLECPATRRAALAHVFRAEFGTGRLVVVERWVLAPSEARIAALWVAAGRPDPVA